MLDPILIDTAKLTQEEQCLSGTVALKELGERVYSHELLASAEDVVSYQILGGQDRWQRPFVDVRIQATLTLVCQRCLQPVAFALDDSAHVVFFADEAKLDEAMAADETLEGLVHTPETDVTAMLEDQILMAIPFAPRHEDCANAALERVNQDNPNPFAKLAGLKSSH